MVQGAFSIQKKAVNERWKQSLATKEGRSVVQACRGGVKKARAHLVLARGVKGSKMSCCFYSVALAEGAGRFSKSWRSGEALRDGRRANIAPLFPKGHEDDPRSYRLASAASVPGEIMERVLLRHISGQRRKRR